MHRIIAKSLLMAEGALLPPYLVFTPESANAIVGRPSVAARLLNEAAVNKRSDDEGPPVQ